MLEVVAVAVVEGDADRLAGLVAAQMGLELAHAHAAVAQQASSAIWRAKLPGVTVSPQRRTTRRRGIDLVIHRDGQEGRHGIRPVAVS